MLWIKAKGGLGNRMLSVASGILYANATGRTFVIDWRDGVYADKGINAYHRLFKASLKQEPILDDVGKEIGKTIPAVWHGKLNMSVSEMISQYFSGEHSNPLIYRKLTAPLSLVENGNGSIEVFWAYTSKLGRIKKFLPKTPRKNSNELLRGVFNSHFIPCDAVEQQLHGSLFFRDNQKVLGVHIRYTDLKVPLERLLKRIRRCMAQGKYEHIFLATDNFTIQEQLKSEFSSVFTFDKRFSVNSGQLHSDQSYDLKEQDSQAALLDMYALAKCDGLVYSSRSSFSRVSRILGEFKVEDTFDIDRYNFRIRLKTFIQEYL
ncbi:MAG: nodulation protein NodZ [Arenicella sp.]